MKPVSSANELEARSFYGLLVNAESEVLELGQYVGISHGGPVFNIFPSLVRQDFAMRNVTINPEKIPSAVFAFNEESN